MSVMIAAYHAIASPASVISTPPAQLESDLVRLRESGFAFVSLEDCAAWVAGAADLPERSVAITFDDAYQTVVTEALPVLVRFKVPATVFVITGRLGRDNQWPGQWRAVAPMPLADASGVRALADAGVSIGAHSWSHRQLPSVDDLDLRREVIESADRLEQIVGGPVRHFAYPYGARGRRERALVASRFVTGVSTHPALVQRGAERADLPRLDCHDMRVALALGIAGTGAMTSYLLIRRSLRGSRRAAEETWEYLRVRQAH